MAAGTLTSLVAGVHQFITRAAEDTDEPQADTLILGPGSSEEEDSALKETAKQEPALVVQTPDSTPVAWVENSGSTLDENARKTFASCSAEGFVVAECGTEIRTSFGSMGQLDGYRWDEVQKGTFARSGDSSTVYREVEMDVEKLCAKKEGVFAAPIVPRDTKHPGACAGQE